jgi:hypothetical protein
MARDGTTIASAFGARWSSHAMQAAAGHTSANNEKS